MSLLDKEDFCKGSVTGTIEDVENDMSISFEVFIPKQKFSHSDDDFEIHLDGVYDKDYHGEWSDNLENAMYDSCFLETICDYAFAVKNGQDIIYTDNSCKIYIESSDFEWDVKASEDDAYFTSINTYGVDGLLQLLTKEQKLDEIEEIAQEIGDLMDNKIINNNFASHMREAYEQDFITDDDINNFTYFNVYEELAKWYCIVKNIDEINLNDLKSDIASDLNIDIYGLCNINEVWLEENILECFDNDFEDNLISEDINNFKIDREQVIKIITRIISNKYCESYYE